MSRSKKIVVEGLDDLVKQLDGLKNVEEKLELGREKAAEIVRAAIEAEAPLGPTGNLKRSIQVNPGTLTKRPKNITFVATNYKIAPHSHLVEFGARGGNMPKNPFFSRGYRKSRGAAADALAAAVQPAIDKSI